MESQLDLLQIMLDSSIVVKLVIFILLGSSIYSLSIAWKKHNDLKVVEEQNKDFLKVYREVGVFEDVLQQTSHLEFSSLRQMFVKGYEELSSLSAQTEEEFKGVIENHIFKFGLSAFERSLEQGATDANEKLNSGLSVLASVGSITPFIGLFGTVWGIIDAFTGLASASASLDAVAPGIAEALVATAIGLFAAIPAVWFFNYFSSRNGSINNAMISFSKEFLNSVERAAH